MNNNLAADSSVYEDRRAAIEEQRRRNEQRREQIRLKKRRILAHVRVMFLVFVMAVSAVMMISKQVALYNTQRQINSLNEEIKDAKALTKQRQGELDALTDRDKVEERAINDLGMIERTSGQVVEITVATSDSTEITAKQVEGAGRKLNDAFKSAKENIIGIFTIK